MAHLLTSGFSDVADALYNAAQQEPDGGKWDAFARSAINRYYYSIFLITREMLKEIATWKDSISHKDVPQYLRKLKRTTQDSIRKKPIRAELARLTPSDLNKLYDDLEWIANTLQRGYDLRCLADYEPERLVARQSKTFSLNGTTITEMQGWKRTAETYCNRTVGVLNALK